MSSLGARIATGVVLLPVLFFLIHLGGWPYTAAVLFVIAVGSWEWARIMRLRPGEMLWTGAGAIGLALLVSNPALAFRTPALLACYLVVTLGFALFHTDGNAWRHAAHIVLGVLYLGLLPAFLLNMRALPDGRSAVFLAYIVVFGCDTGAFLFGRAFGRHRLWTRISPRKTWEGAWAGLLTALALAVAGNELFGGFLSLSEALGFGLIIGTLGQVGDLVESLLKREAGVKDSSSLMPGHGGFLDRFDNLHFVAPLLYIYLVACL